MKKRGRLSTKSNEGGKEIGVLALYPTPLHCSPVDVPPSTHSSRTTPEKYTGFCCTIYYKYGKGKRNQKEEDTERSKGRRWHAEVGKIGGLTTNQHQR